MSNIEIETLASIRKTIKKLKRDGFTYLRPDLLAGSVPPPAGAPTRRDYAKMFLRVCESNEDVRRFVGM